MISGHSHDHEEIRRLLGGYVLGGLDEADRFRVDAHLSSCAQCRDAVDRLAPVPELLQRLPGGGAAGVAVEAPTREGLQALLERAHATEHTGRRPAHQLQLTVAAAVVVALLITTLVLLVDRSPRRDAGPAQSPVPSASTSAVAGTVVEFVAADGSGLSGRATLTPRQWGVSVALEVAGLPGEGPFVLRVTGRAGQSEQAACWGRTAGAAARVTGASSIQLRDVAAVTVSDAAGHLIGSAKPA